MILDIDGAPLPPLNAALPPVSPPTSEVAKIAEPISQQLLVKELERAIQDYLLDCGYRLNSKSTIDTRRIFLKNFVWFLRHHGFETVGKEQIQLFMLYLHSEHINDGGRWGHPTFTEPLRPVSIKDYFVVLKLLFDWLVSSGAIESSPMRTLPRPPVQVERVRTFTQQQILALVKAARKSIQPLRNEAIIWFLFDTGVRASELCNLKMSQLDMDDRCCTVLGKGNKKRLIYFGRNANRALRSYLRKRQGRADIADSPVFLGERGPNSDDGLRPNGLLQLIQRLGQAAGLQAEHLSPHTSHLSPFTSHLSPHTFHLTPFTSHLSSLDRHRVPPRRWKPVHPQGDARPHYPRHDEQVRRCSPSPTSKRKTIFKFAAVSSHQVIISPTLIDYFLLRYFSCHPSIIQIIY